MVTTIDSLVVTLGLDPTGFTKGQKDAVESFKRTQEGAKKAASQMEADGKQAGRFYSNIKGEALSLIAVLVGAKDIAGFLGKTVTDLSAVGRISVAMGLSTDSIQAVSMAVERMHGNAQGAQQSMLGLTQTMKRWQLLGEQPATPFLTALGKIGGTQADDPMVLLQKFAAYASRTKNKQDVETYGQALFGNQDLINLAIGGRKDFDSRIAQSYKNGIPTDTDIKKVQALQEAFGNLAQSVKFAGTELVIDVADPLTHLLDAIDHFVRDEPGFTKAALAFVAAMVAIKGVGLTVGAARAVGAIAPAAASGGGVLGPALGAAGIVVGALPLVGFSTTPATVGAFQRASANPDTASDADLRGAIAFARHNLDNAPGAYRAAAAAQLERLAQAGIRRWGDARTGAPGTETPQERARGGPGFGTPDAPPRVRSAAVRDRAAVAQAYLEQGGFTSAQAKGIVAGLYAETAGTLSPNAKNPTSSATGLAQWLKPRQRDFERVMGVDVQHADFGQQLQFVLYELQHGILNAKTGARSLDATRAIRAQSDPAAAAYAFIHSFEAPGAVGEMADMRSAGSFLHGDGKQGNETVVNVGGITVNGAGDPHAVARHVVREITHQIVANANSGPQ